MITENAISKAKGISLKIWGKIIQSITKKEWLEHFGI